LKDNVYTDFKKTVHIRNGLHYDWNADVCWDRPARTRFINKASDADGADGDVHFDLNFNKDTSDASKKEKNAYHYDWHNDVFWNRVTKMTCFDKDPDDNNTAETLLSSSASERSSFTERWDDVNDMSSSTGVTVDSCGTLKSMRAILRPSLFMVRSESQLRQRAEEVIINNSNYWKKLLLKYEQVQPSKDRRRFLLKPISKKTAKQESERFEDKKLLRISRMIEMMELQALGLEIHSPKFRFQDEIYHSI